MTASGFWLGHSPSIVLLLRVGCLEATSSNPFQNGPILIARFISMPALAAIVRSKIVADIARTVRRPGWLDQEQALVGSRDVHDAHRVFVVFLAVLV